MKKILRNGIVLILATLMMSVLSINTSKAQGSVSLQVFYDELQPYGTWMQHRNYGYVWIPRVDRGFTPYATNGYWINTEYGNTWVSDYSWGWAPFHYGRWFYDDFDGWIWVPDTEWAPAWVAWRSGGGYYGWAPMMPGISINVSFNHYHRIPNHYWSFVPYRYITYRTVYNHCVPRTHVVNIIHNTTIITNNYYTDNRRSTYFTGPSRHEMERTGRERVEVYKINDRNRPGRSDIDRGTVSFYKPNIDDSRDSRARAMPSRYTRKDESGKLEQVESSRDRSSEFQNDKMANNYRNLQQGRQNAQGENQQRDLSTQRSQQFERENLNRSNQPLERERQRTSLDEQRNFNQGQRTQSMERRNENGGEQKIQREREQFNQNELRRTSERQPQRMQQFESPNKNRSPRETRQGDQNIQRDREQYNQNTLRRTPDQQPQRQQQVERQNTNRLNQMSQNSQRERSTISPNNSRNSMPQREQQLRRSSSEQRSIQPSRSTGGSGEGSPRRRN